MRLLTILLLSLATVHAGKSGEFLGESEARVIKELSVIPDSLTGKLKGLKPPKSEDWRKVSDLEMHTMEGLTKALLTMRTREGDLLTDEDRKELDMEDTVVMRFWRIETGKYKEVEIDPSIEWQFRMMTFLVLHKFNKVDAELVAFREASEGHETKIEELRAAFQSARDEYAKYLSPYATERLVSTHEK